MRWTATLLAIASLSATAAAADSHTTRIETRTVNGAVITFEEGVRVMRPLPRERHVIVNPRGATPLVIGVDAGAGAFVAPNPTAAQR